MITWLSSFMMSPALAVLGVLAVSSPIIIHLLNKRRFKIIDWAAMEFLFDADKRNRRRVRLENLLLLLLRCFAMLLLGLLLARPILESSITRFFNESPEFERIVLLDNSLSMRTQSDNQSAMDDAKASLIGITRGLVDNNSDDRLTVILTSDPDSPIINGERVTKDAVEEIVAQIQDLQPSDKTANLDVALLELIRFIESEEEDINRVVYVMSDMRQRDWRMDDEEADANHPAKLLEQLSTRISGCFLVDVGTDDDGNLSITDIGTEDTLIAGVSSRYDVKVANHGDQAVDDVRVKFTVGDSIPLEETIKRIEAGKSETVQFGYTFDPEDVALNSTGLEVDGEENDNHPSTSARITAQVIAGEARKQDRLPDDSERFFAARVLSGVPTLVVDGDPSATFGRSESIYLKRALAPPGKDLSGVNVDVVTDTELETVSLSKYHVIFLCNVFFDRLAEQRVKALEDWTKAGGGLVIMPGEQVDEDSFNELLFRDGEGLSPIKLEGLKGDETHDTWVNFRVVANDNHPFLRVFVGEKNPFLDRVKIFRWWDCSVLKDALVQVPAYLTDEDETPAIVEKQYGEGRVVAMCLPADNDWANWGDDPSYFIVMYELVRHLAGHKKRSGNLEVGQTLTEPLDLVDYEENASLNKPNDERDSVQAVHLVGDPKDKGSELKTIRQIDYSGVDRRGFYELRLTRKTGGEEPRLYAANIDSSEGFLRRLDQAGRRKLTSDNVKIVSGDQAALQTVRGSQIELWKYVLLLVVVVLCAEQFLGWFFGLRR